MVDRVEVVPGLPAEAGPGQPIGGQAVFDIPGAHIGLVRLAPGAVGKWHHHAACNFFGYVLSGTLTLEHGPGGRTVERIPAGRFVRIPPRVIHRDRNDSGVTVLVATACIGPEPMSQPADGPEP